MLSTTKLTIYMVFIMTLALWVGGGVFDSISGHPAWYADPVPYIRDYSPPPGTVNPWPVMTALIGLATLVSLAAFARYRGPGRREVLVVLLGVLAILIATGVYFVPTLIKLANHAALTDAQVSSLSLTWMRLNALRIALLLALLTYSLVGLVRLVRPRPSTSERHV